MFRPSCAVARPLPIARRYAALAALIAVAWPCAALAQQQPTPPAQPAPQQFQPSAEWGKLPKMLLERQFAGPLQDTVIQRLRDPVDGTICYLYLPISAPHSPTTATGFVQYGPNTIGSINCVPGTAAAPMPATRKKPAPSQ
jgi:hypothetical protein